MYCTPPRLPNAVASRTTHAWTNGQLWQQGRRSHSREPACCSDTRTHTLLGTCRPSMVTCRRCGRIGPKKCGCPPPASRAAIATLLVAPPPGRAAAGWLDAYRGDVVLFAGEGRGGAHADEEFFATLERFFTLVRTEPLQPFPGGCEKLWILQRKQSLRNVPSASLPSIS